VREHIAQMIGTTLFTVSRLMSRWEAGEIVEVGRQRWSSASRTR
jgi:CRP-like cAMP-binding protein